MQGLLLLHGEKDDLVEEDRRERLFLPAMIQSRYRR